MADGRILHGQIISENDLEVVFEYTHKALGITTKLILQMENISKIERDIAMDTPEQLDEDTENDEVGELPESQIENDPSQLSKLISKYGASLSSDSPDLTSLYIVPMRGQMGTDVHPSIYRKIADDIKATKPDLIIISMDSSDSKTDEFFGSVPKDEQSILLMDEYLEIANIFRVELKDFPQVLWINTSVGLSSMLALAWSDMYMKPSGKFAGLDLVVDKSGADKWSDADVRAKMMAAWTGHAKSFAEYGGYPMELCAAMLEPHYKLSASFKGREVVW
ncbi:MAG: hypothetical protein IH891_09640, partial [Planctomycetes bacterium]|nr:hypothetical protein [Planctomycetota bacterium]